MQETARVVEIKGNRVALVPLDSESCAGCTNARCKEGGYIFYAKNPKSLPVQKGSLVRVAASASVQTVEIITGILFPILVAVLVYVFSSVFSSGVSLFSSSSDVSGSSLIGSLLFTT